MDYTVKRHQEMGLNKIKSRAVRPKATTRAEDNFISHQLVWQNADCSKHHWTAEPMSWKNVSTSTVRRRRCETGLYGRIAVKKPTVEEAKQCQKAPVGQGAQRLDNRAVE